MKTDKYDTAAIGFRIKKTRENLGYTQEYISNQIDVNTQHVSDIERGVAGISVAKLIKLCDILNITSDYILYGKDIAHAGSSLYELINKLSEKEKQFMETTIELYIKQLK